MCQLPDLYASATPHSLRSYGVCSVARSLSRYRLVTHSFRQAAPKPTYAPTAFVLSSARSVLRTSIADNNTSIGFVGLTFLVHRLKARNWRCLDERETIFIFRDVRTSGHTLHCVYDCFRCTDFEFCSGSLNVATPHSDIELQAARRHFFGGIATNCLNNSKSAPLSLSSSPLRTAPSSPPIAVLNLAFGKR